MKTLTHQKQQTGVVLVVGLIMLVLLTLIGLTSMQVNALEEKMAGNSRDQNLAFQAAESALKEAEIFILNNPIDALTYTGANGLLNFNDAEPANFFNLDWTNANSASTPNNFGTQLGVPTNPRYIIKKVSQNGIKTYFRITARALGRSPGTQIILQEHFVREN